MEANFLVFNRSTSFPEGITLQCIRTDTLTMHYLTQAMIWVMILHMRMHIIMIHEVETEEEQDLVQVQGIIKPDEHCF